MMVFEEHLVTLLEESRHRVVPAVTGEVNPFKIKKEEALVLMVTELPLSGARMEGP